MKTRIPKHSKGFGLVEILVTMVVLGVAMIALAKLQGEFMKSSSNARARTDASSIAQRKIEDLRSFSQITAGAAGVYGFDEIGNNAGGEEDDAGNLILDDGNITQSNTVYALSWIATDMYLPPDQNAAGVVAGDWDTTNWGPLPTAADYKDIEVTVSWNDQTGDQTITLASAISRSDPGTGAQTLDGIGAGNAPIVLYNPGAAPDYVTIVDKETSKPTPVVSQNAQFTTTTFDAVTYDTSTLETESREEFITVNCVCQQEGEGTGREPTIYTATGDLIGNQVTKRTGSRVTTGQEGQQSELCNTCCADHHDHSGGTYKYDPYRPSSDYDATTGDHHHYYPDENGDLQVADADGDLYLEACRFKRIDGILRVMPDWNLTAMQVMPADFVASNTADYEAYIIDYVRAYISGITDPSAYAANPSVNEPTVSVSFTNEPTTDSMGTNAQQQFIARGVYIDYMTADLIESMQEMISDDPTGYGFLGLAPFYEVNLTQLAVWGIRSDGVDECSGSAAVTSEPIADDGTHSRGMMTAESGSPCVQASIERSNTGLTDTAYLDPDDENAGNTRTDFVKVSISDDAVPENPTVTGTISIAGGLSVNPSDIVITGVNGAVCFKFNLDTQYQCTLDADGNGGIAISNYNYIKLTGNTSSVVDNKVCPAGGTIVDDGTLDEVTTRVHTGVTGTLADQEILIGKSNTSC